jgi:anti-anti-sigma regulatory factor
MEIGVSQMRGKVPVTVLRPTERIDGTNYNLLIAKAQEAYLGGARNFLLDLSDVTYVSSAGLVALHSIVMLTRFGVLPEEESGWESFRAIDRNSASGYQPHVKLLNPQARVDKVLSISGMNQFLEIFTDLDEAISAF